MVWIVGHRGIYFYDQSGLFDGAWRLVQGQTIYRDFYVPYGPVIFFIQALFFRIAGVDFSSMVLSAAVVNSIAVVLVMWVVRHLLPDIEHRPAAVAAGLVTAVWFQAPSGTLWYEQVGFLFNLIALALVLLAAQNGRMALYARLAAGSCLVLSILSKQTAGAVFLGVPIGAGVLACLPNGRKALRVCWQIAAGMLIAATVFAVWLWLFSSPAGFWQSVVIMSRALAADRTARLPGMKDLVWLTKTWSSVWLAVTLTWICAALRGASSIRNGPLIIWLVLAYVFSQNLFASLTLNEVENEIGYIGLINGLTFGLFYEVFWKNLASKYGIAYWATVPLMAVVVYSLFLGPMRNGWYNSRHRLVMQFSEDTTFSERVNVRGALRLRWGEPTIVGGMNVTRTDFEGLNMWLDQANANFFVFPDSTILYGLHKRISPQPWVNFMPQHSFLRSQLPQVDATILKSLQKNNVSVVVLEKTSYSKTHELLREMPQLRNWITNHFEKRREFGLYEVWTLREGNGTALKPVGQ